MELFALEAREADARERKRVVAARGHDVAVRGRVVGAGVRARDVGRHAEPGQQAQELGHGLRGDLAGVAPEVEALEVEPRAAVGRRR